MDWEESESAEAQCFEPQRRGDTEGHGEGYRTEERRRILNKEQGMMKEEGECSMFNAQCSIINEEAGLPLAVGFCIFTVLHFGLIFSSLHYFFPCCLGLWEVLRYGGGTGGGRAEVRP